MGEAIWVLSAIGDNPGTRGTLGHYGQRTALPEEADSTLTCGSADHSTTHQLSLTLLAPGMIFK